MLELAHISQAFGAKSVLRDVSCRFEAGKISALIGPNGAGKTSLLRIAAGLETPNAGTVRLDGTNFADAQAPRAQAGLFAAISKYCLAAFVPRCGGARPFAVWRQR